MANIPIISLNSGKLSPLVDTRSDTEKYDSGCRELKNMLPLIYGPVTRRPGTKYIANVDNDSKKSRMIPFIYSATIAYEVELADQIINVYFDGVAVDTDIATPYLEADLFQIQFKQSADVMWLVHPSYAPRKLSRVSPTEFTLTEIDFQNGPFQERNDLANADGVTMDVTGTIITSAIAATDTIIFPSATDLTDLFPVNQRIYLVGTVNGDQAFTVATSAFGGGNMTITTNESIPYDEAGAQLMYEGGDVVLIPSTALFVTGAAGDIDRLYKITHKRFQSVVSGNISGTGVIDQSIDVKGSWTFTTTGNWAATIEIQRLAEGTNEWEVFRTYTSSITNGQGSRNVQKSDVEEADNVQYRIYVRSGGTGDGFAELEVDSSTQDSIFKVTQVNNSTSANATAIIPASTQRVSSRWAAGSWSHTDINGWPSAVTFFDERVVYGFTNTDGQNVWLSGIGDFEDFEPGINDSDAFTLALPTANRGRWLGSLDALAAGTTGDEWRIRSTSFDQALTPTNFSIKQQTARGSTDIQALEVNDAILFVDYVARKIREFTWSEAKQKFVSPDLTALIEDITLGGITSMAVQRNPDSIIWMTLASNPYLISMTYEREQNVVAYAEHPLGGNGIAESVSVIPGTTEDRVTLTVKRTVNGSVVRFIETMQSRQWTDDKDAYYVDAGLTDTGGDTTITGLSHLEGELVNIWGDGIEQQSKVVVNGQVEAEHPADTYQVGLPIDYEVSPMRLDVNTPKGTTHGSIKKIGELVFSFYKSQGVKYGNGTDTRDIPLEGTDLFTGDVTVPAFDGFSTEDNIFISGSGPGPCTLRAIIPRMDVTGR